MADPRHDAETSLVLIVTKPDQPRLVHIFCGQCDVVDQMAGRKETPYCGAKKAGPWRASIDTNNSLVCVVCIDLSQSKCQRCTREGR